MQLCYQITTDFLSVYRDCKDVYFTNKSV